MSCKRFSFVFFCFTFIMGILGYTQEPFSIKEFAQYVTDDDPCNLAFYSDAVKAPPGEVAALVFKKDGSIAVWGHDSKHTIVGKQDIWDHEFIGDEENPLQFRVDKEAGYVYIKGKGTVTFPDGRIEKLPKKPD